MCFPCIKSLSLVLLFAAAWKPASVLGHCPEIPPIVKLNHLADGVVEHVAFFPDRNATIVDTASRKRLTDTLVARYQRAKHVVYGYVDKVRNYYTHDTIRYNGAVDYINTKSTEDVDFSIYADLKGVMPDRQFSRREKWDSLPNLPFAYTYTGFLDTPFVAFFDIHDSIADMGIGPVDGCYFEPQGFFIYNDSIHKKGLGGQRMAGVAVSIADFFIAIGQPKIEAPPVRKGNGIVRNPKGLLPINPGSRPGGIFPYDLSGRRLSGFPGAPPGGGSKKGKIAMGWYFLKPQEE